MDTYEKKYKEALELARVAAFNGHQSLMEGIFPELKESEDEKIKKEIISFIQDDIDEINLKVSGDYNDRDEDDIAHQNWCKKAIAWLENIPYTIDHEKREGFHLGYKAGLEKQGESYTKRDVDDAYVEGMALAKYELEKQGNSPIKWNKNTEDCKPKVNHSVLMKTTHSIAEGEWKGEYWEQYRWAGIVRDSDVLSWMELSDLDKQGEQKSAWSIKEKLMLNDIIETTERSNIFKENYQRELIGWLKSLKNRVLPQPKQEWSGEDEKMCQETIDWFEKKCFPYALESENPARESIKWLKSLKERIGR